LAGKHTDISNFSIKRSNLDGTNDESLFAARARGIALDLVERKIYISAFLGTPPDAIQVANMAIGAIPTTLISSNEFTTELRAIAVDSSGRKIYWTSIVTSPSSLGVVARSNLDGTDPEYLYTQVFGTGLRGIALDIPAGKIYFVDQSAATISRINMEIPAGDTPGSRTDIEVMQSGLDTPDYITINQDGSYIYWGEAGSADAISRAPTTPLSTVQVLVDTDVGLSKGIALDNAGEVARVYWADATFDTIKRAIAALHAEINPRTMWTSYGTVPANGKGINLEIKESFPEISESDPAIGSLVGLVRQTKEISEAVVVIPYLDNAATQEILTDGTTTVERQELTIEKIPGKNFFRIPDWNFDGQKENIEKGLPAVPGDDNVLTGVQYNTTTVSDMIGMMKKYVMPPDFDFVRYDDIDPFVMYIFEFAHVLEREELTDIWQGIMPSSALKMENDEVKIAHRISDFEFFGNVVEQKILGDMKFFVFKVKKRAKQNYYEMTEDSTDDSRYKFNFANDGAVGAVPPQGSYNWPYDFFSLVEKAKVETKITIEKLPPPPPPTEET